MTSPTEITDEEAAFGLELRASPTGVPMVVRTLASGLLVIKQSENDKVVYAICDATFKPLYRGATSIAELRVRFGARGK